LKLFVRKLEGHGWVVAESNEDGAPTLLGPDSMGEHRGHIFSTMADAAHAAQWRIERLEDGQGTVERGSPW